MTMKTISEALVAATARELALEPGRVAAAAALLAEGATVPFIARYRKERTGSLDEVQIAAIRDLLARLEAVEERRGVILAALEERELLTAELEAALRAAQSLTALEDLYLPFRPKRRTRATMARERGLEPLADLLWTQDSTIDPEGAAAAYVDPEREIPDTAAALAGARDILAERIAEEAQARAELRGLMGSLGVLSSAVRKGKADEPEAQKFRDWFAFSEPVARAAGHRILALRRGEAEGVLALRVTIPEENVQRVLERRFVQGRSPASDQVAAAAVDAWKRLLSVSLETEMRLELKQRADAEATAVFAANLRELLLAPALGQKTVLALDPGFRTGCKLVLLDPQGELLHHETIFPLSGGERAAVAVVEGLCRKYAVRAVAVGNGTGGREAEAWVRCLDLPADCVVVSVNEAGASVYSASAVARQEFPDKDVTVRGAVSIGRRLQDPLAELVKIDPKAIGVGQYQHDVDQGLLRQALEDTIMSCVNAVGVELNSASPQLLEHVSGLGPALAENIVRHRAANGPFASRRALLQVPRLGPKAFEQAAGFLRIRGAANPLDASAVHPERYPLVRRMAADLGLPVERLVGEAALVEKIRLQEYVGDGVGLPTLRDIRSELLKPGRDPRESFEPFFFADVQSLEDLQVGMRLPGIVTNVTSFGAFVDVGVHQDGLVHISQLADCFVRDPSEVVRVNQRVMVSVLEVDLQRGRIALSMRQTPGR